jgi:FkbM family methyltransferase
LRRNILQLFNSAKELNNWRKLCSNWFEVMGIFILSEWIKPIRNQTIHIYLDNGVSLDTKGSRQAINPVFEIFGDIYHLNSCPIWRLYEIHAVIDLGAHVGSFSVRMALEQQPWTMIALEPDPAAYDLLQRNLSSVATSSTTIRCVRAAIGPTTTLGWYSSSGNADWGGHIVNEPEVLSAKNQIVQILSLADVLGSYEDTAGVLLKMDVEGSEYETLYQSTISDLHKVAVLVLEYHPSEIARHNFESINDFLHHAGFALVWHDNGIAQGNACYARPLAQLMTVNRTKAHEPQPGPPATKGSGDKNQCVDTPQQAK